MPLEKISRKNGWFRVKDVDSQIHWIKEDLVSSKFQCAVIREEFANLRTGPGIQFPAVPAKKGEKYLSFKVLEKKGDWLKLQDQEGSELWAHEPLMWVR